MAISAFPWPARFDRLLNRDACTAERIKETVSNQEVDMTYEQIKEIARERGIRIARVKKAEVVRAIQAQEGNEPCFATGRSAECSQIHCLWLKACD